MSRQRITVSFPNSVHEDMLEELEGTTVSKFVTEAVRDKIIDKRIKKASAKGETPWEAMRRLSKDLPRMTTEEILEAIHQGRP